MPGGGGEMPDMPLPKDCTDRVIPSSKAFDEGYCLSLLLRHIPGLKMTGQIWSKPTPIRVEDEKGNFTAYLSYNQNMCTFYTEAVGYRPFGLCPQKTFKCNNQAWAMASENETTDSYDLIAWSVWGYNDRQRISIKYLNPAIRQQNQQGYDHYKERMFTEIYDNVNNFRCA
jgi:hypothetical protein